MSKSYLEFLKSKIEMAPVSGFSVPEEDINPALKPHQRDAVRWALRGGRRALFESFGLGKSAQELEFCHHAAKHEGKPALIVLPLGLRIPLVSEFQDMRDPAREKEDCELNAFLRLTERLKQEFPRLPVCLLLDGLYPVKAVFDRCRAYGWKLIGVPHQNKPAVRRQSRQQRAHKYYVNH